MKGHTWAAAFGITAALLLVIGVIMSGNSPEGDAPAEEWIDYIEEDESLTLARAYVLLIAGLALVAFYVLGVEPRLAGTEPTDRALAHLGGAAAVLGAGAFAFAGLIGAAVGAAHIFADIPIDASLARLFDNLFYGALIVGSAVPLGAVMAVVAIQTKRRKAFASWVLWLSLLGVLGMAASLLFLPYVLLPIWLIAVSVAVARGGEPAGGDAAA